MRREYLFVSAAMLWFGAASVVAQETRVQHELQRIAAPAPPPPYMDDLAGWSYNNHFGMALGMTDEWAAIADSDTLGENGGEVYLYRKTAQGWTYSQRIDVAGARLYMFGADIAINKNMLVVGAPGYGEQTEPAGRVYYYTVGDDGQWHYRGLIEADGLPTSEGPILGRAVAVSNGVLVAGAPGVDQPVWEAGEVRIYEQRPADWEAIARFRLPPTTDVLNFNYGRLGMSVAVDGNTVVAGAPFGKGAVCVYERNEHGWSMKDWLTDPDGGVWGDNFGQSVAIQGNTLVVGRPVAKDSNPRPGRVFVYERNAQGEWVLAQVLQPTDGFAGGQQHGDEFGYSVALDGKRIVVGAFKGEYNGPRTGTVYLYERRESGWPEFEDARFVASDSSGYDDLLGIKVALHGEMALAGASGAWNLGKREGKAYTFGIELGTVGCSEYSMNAPLALLGSPVIAEEGLTLALRDTPPGSRAVFFISPVSGHVPFENDLLCLGRPVRQLGFVHAGQDGVSLFDVKTDAGQLGRWLRSGTTWHFQAAYEGRSGSGVFDNITNSITANLH